MKTVPKSALSHYKAGAIPFTFQCKNNIWSGDLQPSSAGTHHTPYMKVPLRSTISTAGSRDPRAPPGFTIFPFPPAAL